MGRDAREMEERGGEGRKKEKRGWEGRKVRTPSPSIPAYAPVQIQSPWIQVPPDPKIPNPVHPKRKHCFSALTLLVGSCDP